MEKSNMGAILGYFKSMKKQAQQIIESSYRLQEFDIKGEQVYGFSPTGPSFYKIKSQAKALAESYSQIRGDVEKELNIKLPLVGFPYKTEEVQAESLLQKLILECDKVIGYIESLEPKIPLELKNKLDSLKEELQTITANISNTDFERNLEISIEECEKGDYLASWLISGRVIRYIFEKIPGKDINEKLKFLEDNNIVPKDKKEIVNLILRIDKETRNIGSHNISSFPQPKEAISLITDSLKLLELIWVKLEPSL